jgi:hypothetical protein
MPSSLMDFLTLEDGTDTSPWNVDKELPLSGCVISQKSAALTWWFGSAGPGLTPHGPVQNDQVQCFMCEFKMTSHIWAPNLRKKNLVLHWSKYGNILDAGNKQCGTLNMDRGSMIIQYIPHKMCETSGCYLNLVYNIVMLIKTKKDAMYHS